MNKLERLISIWKDALGIDTVDFNADFFSLGGTSIKAVSMIFKTEQAFHIEIPLSILAGSLTLGKLQAALEDGLRSSDALHTDMETGFL